MNKEELVLSLIEKLLGSETPETSEKSGYAKYKGKIVFCMTVTHYFLGECVDVTHDTMTLENASWIADTGRLSEFLQNVKNAKEVEPCSSTITIGTGSIVMCTLASEILTEVK